jgi:nucleoside 2-deoxyribosyltransferase
VVIYLASPYSVGPKGAYGEADTGFASKNMRTRRYKAACKKAASLMDGGHVVFSPIAHSHSIETEGMDTVRTGNFWLDQDLAILKRCDSLFVLCLPDWERSRGIKREVDFAIANGIPVSYLEP